QVGVVGLVSTRQALVEFTARPGFFIFVEPLALLAVEPSRTPESWTTARSARPRVPALVVAPSRPASQPALRPVPHSVDTHAPYARAPRRSPGARPQPASRQSPSHQGATGPALALRRTIGRLPRAILLLRTAYLGPHT